MKHVLLTLLFVVFTSHSFSQDYLILNNGEKVAVTVLEVADDYVRYRLFDESSRKMYVKDKSAILKIEFQDGRTEGISGEEVENSKKINKKRARSRQLPAREERTMDMGVNNSEPDIKSVENQQEEIKERYSDNENDDIPDFENRPSKLRSRQNSMNNERYRNNSMASSEISYQDVVYLRDGSVIRGTIIEQNPNKSLKIRTADGNTFVYRGIEVESIAKEPVRGRNRSPFNLGNNTFSEVQPGYKGIVELGYDIGVGDYGIDRLRLNFINSYQFNSFFSLGFGTGLRYYFDEDAAVIPFFADFRAQVFDNYISPYVSLGMGYSFDASNGFDGVGFLLNPTVGASFRIAERSSVNVGLGYEMQRMKFYSYYNDKSRNSGAFSIVAGISF